MPTDCLQRDERMCWRSMTTCCSFTTISQAGSMRSTWGWRRSGNGGIKFCPTKDQRHRDEQLKPLRLRFDYWTAYESAGCVSVSVWGIRILLSPSLCRSRIISLSCKNKYKRKDWVNRQNILEYKDKFNFWIDINGSGRYEDEADHAG